MESHDVLREAFAKSSPKLVASELGVSLSLVYKWTQPAEQEGGTANPLDRTASLMKLTGHSAIIRWLCQQAGGFFVKNPAAEGAQQHDLMPATNEILQYFANLLEAVTTAALDHRVTDDESTHIRRHWDELKSFTEEFVRACEEGDYDKLNKPAPIWKD